jgi:N-acetylated-alpha-linked acidic dipeptidase
MLFISQGNEVPESWKGALPITYRLGPGFSENMKVKMDLHNKIEVKTIYNVIGTIHGQEEPDRYVIVGNHRDSWVFGAVDAVSGTATTSEIARALGLLRKTTWRPRRSIKVKILLHTD